MEVKFLKAGKGDSILLKSQEKNMLIDGGDDSTYLFKELDIIFNDKQCIDIMVITHHDSDHILGIIDFLKELKEGRYGAPTNFVKRVYFNSPRRIKGVYIPNDSNLLNYEHASIAEKLISELELKCASILLDTSAKITLGDMKLTCLSPTKDITDRYVDTKGACLSPSKRCDWNNSLVHLKDIIDDESLDKSPSNLSSIVILLEVNGMKGLLTGDITPKRFAEIISKLYEENHASPVFFDFLKLPHHGSYRNITKEIISKLDCKRYVISTNGKNYLPNKKTLLKIITYQEVSKEKISFLFNYSEIPDKIGITEREKKKYNIALEPNNLENGYCISKI